MYSTIRSKHTEVTEFHFITSFGVKMYPIRSLALMIWYTNLIVYLLAKCIVFCVFSWKLDGEIHYWTGLKMVNERERWTDASEMTDLSNKYTSLLRRNGQCLHFKWDNRFIPSAGSCTERKMYICKRKGKLWSSTTRSLLTDVFWYLYRKCQSESASQRDSWKIQLLTWTPQFSYHNNIPLEGYLTCRTNKILIYQILVLVKRKIFFLRMKNEKSRIQLYPIKWTFYSITQPSLPAILVISFMIIVKTGLWLHHIQIEFFLAWEFISCKRR